MCPGPRSSWIEQIALRSDSSIKCLTPYPFLLLASAPFRSSARVDLRGVFPILRTPSGVGNGRHSVLHDAAAAPASECAPHNLMLHCARRYSVYACTGPSGSHTPIRVQNPPFLHPASPHDLPRNPDIHRPTDASGRLLDSLPPFCAHLQYRPLSHTSTPPAPLSPPWNGRQF